MTLCVAVGDCVLDVCIGREIVIFDPMSSIDFLQHLEEVHFAWWL